MNKNILHAEVAPTKIGRGSRATFLLRFNIEPSDGGGYDYEEIRLPGGRLHYAGIVAALIRSHYTQDDVEAIMNNYVASKTTEHKDEWQALQDWRTRAKEIAMELISLIRTNNEDSEG